MKVILNENIHKLGKIGDVVEISPGYFRNYLQPRSLAHLATEGALKKRNAELEVLKAKAQKLHDEALALAERIEGVGSIRIGAKAGESGKLYGKVTTKDIAEAVSSVLKESQDLEVEVDKRGVKTQEEITQLGTYKANIRIAPDVYADVTVEVVEQK